MKVLLVEDYALFREGLCLILQRLQDDVQTVEAETVEEAIEFAGHYFDFDLVLLDYNLPDRTGLECVFELMALQAEVPKILLSAEQNPALIKASLDAGARGFITKSSSSNVMLSAIRLVLSGGIYVPPEMLNGNESISTTLSDNTGFQPEDQDASSVLTVRQNEVLDGIIRGLSNKEIARELNMSPSTVKVHVAAILREFNVKNRTQAVNYARSNRLI